MPAGACWLRPEGFCKYYFRVSFLYILFYSLFSCATYFVTGLQLFCRARELDIVAVYRVSCVFVGRILIEIRWLAVYVHRSCDGRLLVSLVLGQSTIGFWVSWGCASEPPRPEPAGYCEKSA